MDPSTEHLCVQDAFNFRTIFVDHHFVNYISTDFSVDCPSLDHFCKSRELSIEFDGCRLFVVQKEVHGRLAAFREKLLQRSSVATTQIQECRVERAMKQIQSVVSGFSHIF